MKSDLKKTKVVLLTGAGGFLGRETFEILKGEGFEVIPIVRKKSGLASEKILDLSGDDLFFKLSKLPRSDVIVHIAAKVDFSEVFSPSLFRVNTLASSILAKYAEAQSSRIVFTSTLSIFGSESRLITERSEPRPNSAYGLSKWLAEELIKQNNKRHTIIRFGGIFGRKGPKHLMINRTIDDATRGIIPKVVGSGKSKRNYVFVKDAARIIVYCLKRDLNGTFNFGGVDKISIKEMAEATCKIFLPSKKPGYVNGNNTSSQIMLSSKFLPRGLSFENALKNIKGEL